MAGPPKRHGDEGLIQRPAHCQLKDMLAEILLGKAVKPLDGFQVLRVAGLLEFWVDLTDVVTAKLTVEFHFSAQQSAAKRAVRQRADVVVTAVRQHIFFNAALEQ